MAVLAAWCHATCRHGKQRSIDTVHSCADLVGDIPTGLRLNYDCQLILMIFLNRDAPVASVGETTA